ncbi:IS110 family transposase [Iamia sp. SCSIO 61187]|uniref:IS110 family transposase n=1 Tax=Iamia sp. SCSIO 61187 TaxID=2722752 RepID=UPI001C638306|nr:IS110 family transposase [Iamia sp. SCSIO 61187]QYG91176.1 IS110 family transposase [Iamia sp. SCSIO 61187]QYG91742.1 IS110 family transposase [Iamia sp. SCSIO 61187]
MASIALDRTDVIVGVDTHKDSHVAVAIDGLGGRLGVHHLPATNAGYADLLAWATALGTTYAFGVEGTGSYGIGLARFLRRQGVKVIEVSRPPRAGERRLDGKSDPIDAENAARQVLAGRAATTPKLADGIVEAIRLTRIARNTAVKAHTQAIVALKATLVTAPEHLRVALEPLSDHKLMVACAALGTDGDPADPAVAMGHVLASLAQRWLDLHDEIKTHTTRLKALTTTAAPDLVAAFGIGPDIAGELLVAAGDNTDRISSEAAFAKLCGACPVPTGSGKTSGRHRLNRGGNRQANAALYRAVIVRMRWHAPTIAYVERRTAEGLTKREIIRCLKRYLAREVYALLPPTAAPTAPTAEAA